MFSANTIHTNLLAWKALTELDFYFDFVLFWAAVKRDKKWKVLLIHPAGYLDNKWQFELSHRLKNTHCL
jgi:peptidoglycan/LPS O-acetylase OafA/YrhL